MAPSLGTKSANSNITPHGGSWAEQADRAARMRYRRTNPSQIHPYSFRLMSHLSHGAKSFISIGFSVALATQSSRQFSHFPLDATSLRKHKFLEPYFSSGEDLRRSTPRRAFGKVASPSNPGRGPPYSNARTERKLVSLPENTRST